MRSLVLAAAAAFAALLAAGQAQAGWLKAETEHFVVYHDGPERTLREYAAKLETFDDLLRKRHRLRTAAEHERPLPVYLVDNLDELRRVRPDAPKGVAGFYTASQRDIYAVAVLGREDDAVLHEYVHHFMLRHFPAAYPAWLIEGYAEYYMTAEITPREVNFGHYNEARATWLARGKWAPMADLLRLKPGQVGRDRSMYYAQAWLLTHYMLSTPERLAQLSAYARAVGGEGADPVKAMEVATGRSLGGLEAALRSYMRGGMNYSRGDRKLLVDPVVKISAMPASADELLLLHQQLKANVPDARRAGLLAEIRAAAAKHPGDRFAELVLARAEIVLGDRTAGESILTRRLRADPNDVEALRLFAGSRTWSADRQKDPALRATMLKEAQRYAVRAMKADQTDYETLLVYARTRSEQPGYPNDNDIAALLKAYQLAPQVAGIRINAAHALLKRGRRAEAEALLEPLLNSPHADQASERARAMLERGAAGAVDLPEPGGTPAT